jgi:hypothetical protein
MAANLYRQVQETVTPEVYANMQAMRNNTGDGIPYKFLKALELLEIPVNQENQNVRYNNTLNNKAPSQKGGSGFIIADINPGSMRMINEIHNQQQNNMVIPNEIFLGLISLVKQLDVEAFDLISASNLTKAAQEQRMSIILSKLGIGCNYSTYDVTKQSMVLSINPSEQRKIRYIQRERPTFFPRDNQHYFTPEDRALIGSYEIKDHTQEEVTPVIERARDIRSRFHSIGSHGGQGSGSNDQGNDFYDRMGNR